MYNVDIERVNFIEMLNEVFLSHTGHGAFAYLSSVESLDLFERFREQSLPARQFIKGIVKTFL